jgi:NAD(P)-dependent dehydrogenase (short-subunit alcohol dehydrogenase family)
MTFELTGLSEKVAIVTGAGRMRSIGRPIAVELARAGCDVVITGTGRAPADYPADEQAAGWRDIESVAEEIRALGQRCLPVVSDIADEGAVDALVARTIDELGRVDIVVNNAGAARGPDRFNVVDLDPAEWRKVIDVNLNGTFLLSRAVSRHWLAVDQPGCIVNISSVGGKIAGPGTAAYSASKAAIHALGAAMAAELGPAGIRVNAICPGMIRTALSAKFYEVPGFEEKRAAVTASRRVGEPHDVAHVTMFLASERSSYMNGAELVVDGGMQCMLMDMVPRPGFNQSN